MLPSPTFHLCSTIPVDGDPSHSPAFFFFLPPPSILPFLVAPPPYCVCVCVFACLFLCGLFCSAAHQGTILFVLPSSSVCIVVHTFYYTGRYFFCCMHLFQFSLYTAFTCCHGSCTPLFFSSATVELLPYRVCLCGVVALPAVPWYKLLRALFYFCFAAAALCFPGTIILLPTLVGFPLCVHVPTSF